MKFKHYIWDFDGCLCDSYPHTAQMFLEAMRRHGRTELPPYEDVFLRLQVTWLHARDYFGMTPEEYKTLHELDHDFTNAPVPRLFDGIRETLEDIVAAGGKNYLYTLRNHVAKDALDAYGVSHLFTDFVTRENGFPGKPAPDAVTYLLEKHCLNPAETVMVGDRDIDGQSGINAGAAGCLLTVLDKNCYGEDMLTSSAMPMKARGVGAFREIMEISKR